MRNQVRDWGRREGLAAYDRRTHEGLLRNLVVREGRRTGQIQVAARHLAGELRPSLAASDLPHGRRADRGERHRRRRPVVARQRARSRRSSRGLRFRISPEAFFQTNTEMAERLYGLAAEYAGLRGSERVFDLYCGIGTIGLTLAARAGEVWGVEIVGTAIADAIENARLNEIDNAHFFAGDVRHAIRPLLERAGRPDVVVVDPPRAGLSKKVVRRVIECDAPRIVYVSCNPTTLAPNAAQLVEAGYRLRRVKPRGHVPADAPPRVRGAARREPPSGRGFGVAAGLDPEIAAPVAARCAELGYRSMWSNDHPGAKGLETVAVFAKRRRRARLGVAVLALDRHAPDAIAADIERLGFDA